MMKDITKSKRQETEDIIKDLKNKESLERAKMRLDCLSIFDGYENFSFYYELLMSNQKEYIKTKSWELLKRKNELQFDRYRAEKALETASEEETQKLNIKIRAIYREINLISKRIAFLNEATFSQLLKDFQDEYKHVRLNEIRNIEETPVTNRDEVIFGVLNSPNGTMKLQSIALKISELKKKIVDVRTRVNIPYGYFPYLNAKLFEATSGLKKPLVLNKEEISKLSKAVSNSENEYFKALMNLNFFEEHQLSYLLSLDATDFKEIRHLIPEYKKFIPEDLQLLYAKTYREYINKNSKIFGDKKEKRETERYLMRLAQMILISIRRNLIKTYEEIETKFGYRETIKPLSLEGILELKGTLKQRTDAAYAYLLDVKAEIESAKTRLVQIKDGMQDAINESYENLGDISGVNVTEEIVPVKISEYISVYKKVYNKHILNEINQAVEEELAKHNITQKGGITLTKINQHKED